MTREDKIRALPRFKKIVCSQMCKHTGSCFCSTDEEFIACPYFHGYITFGWPVRRICDISVNSYKLPDLRKTDPTQEDINYWRNPSSFYGTSQKVHHIYKEWKSDYFSGQTYLGLNTD